MIVETEEFERLKRVGALADEVMDFLRSNSPNAAANKAVLNCIEVVKAKAQMFRTFAVIAGREDRFSVNMTLADEMLLLARELQKFVINLDIPAND